MIEYQKKGCLIKIMETIPIEKQERIISIDILRGLSLFGIFLVNMPDFNFKHLGVTYTGTEAFFRLLYDLFIQQKFYLIFSFLFGLSFYIFMSRAEQKQQKNIYVLSIRRLLALFLFGMIHQLLWNGDILTKYALYGLILLAFYRQSSKVILTLLALLGLLFFWGISGVSPNINSTMVIFVLPILIMFLFGFYIGKIKLFMQITEKKKYIRGIQFIALIFSFPGLYETIKSFMYMSKDSFLSIDSSIVALSALPLSLFYIATFILLLENHRIKKLLNPVKYIGQMSLTNYILQTLIGITLSRVLDINLGSSLLLSFFIASIIYILQIVISMLWLKSFRYGPLELIWRLITYGNTIKKNGYMYNNQSVN